LLGSVASLWLVTTNGMSEPGPDLGSNRQADNIQAAESET
jgi:hypothetical protein